MKSRQVLHPFTDEPIGHAHNEREARAVLLEHVPPAFVGSVELRAGAWEAVCERHAVALSLPHVERLAVRG